MTHAEMGGRYQINFLRSVSFHAFSDLSNQLTNWISRPYFAYDATDRLLWHLSNMKTITKKWQVYLQSPRNCLTEQSKKSLVTPISGFFTSCKSSLITWNIICALTNWVATTKLSTALYRGPFQFPHRRRIWTWWRHHIEASSTLLALCVGNSPVTGELPSQRPVTQTFDVFFDLRLNKRLS